MKFSTNFKKTVNTTVGGLWGDRFNVQILLDSEVNNVCSLTINGEHIKCNFIIPTNNSPIYRTDINKLVDTFLFEINELNKKDYYNIGEVLNILCSSLLGNKQYSNDLLSAVLDNEYDVDEYVYSDEEDCEEEDE